MKGQVSHVQTVVFLISCLVFMIFFLGMFDTALCNNQIEMYNATENYTSNEGIGYFLNHAFNLQCSGVPWYVKFFIYVPILGGLIYALIPFK